MHASLDTSTPPVAQTDILIIGSGFAGLGLGIRLKREGRHDFLILERADDVGGTWRDNDYPGAACDVPSHLYSFSFRPNPSWSRVFSPGPEIQRYLQQSARDEALLPHIRFQTEMLAAHWDAQTRQWRVQTNQGVYLSRILVTATGHLADEHLPAIEGLTDFAGAAFHSARWDHSVALEGKRIGVVGSGASAIQIVPEMARRASELVVFQRSAPYLIPRMDRAYSAAEQRLFERLPDTMSALRDDIFWTGEYNFAQRRNIPRFVEEAKTMALTHLSRQVEDPELRRQLTPNYEIGCKRLLISNDYYPSLTQPHVTLEPSALARIDGERAVAASGRSYELDVLIFATGFEAVRPPFAQRVHGTHGLSLDQQWSQGMQAYDSISVHHFPNLFIINGPNTGLGHNSVVYIIEAQVDYILDGLRHMEAQGLRHFETRPAAEADYMDRLQRRSAGSVWLEGGCKSWYVDPRSGRLTLVWPDYAHAFRDENSTFHPAGYALTP